MAERLLREPAERHHPEDPRSEAEHDKDRILYSSAFRRLSGITQVISPTGKHPTHNRLTHSLEVAQISRGISQTLLKRFGTDNPLIVNGGGLDCGVVEAAALAHDLGHPPFGHVAEEALNSFADKFGDSVGGFEGNAQSFRIVTRLAAKRPDYKGLNLTAATLSAMSKYPWGRNENTGKKDKWGYYEDDAAAFNRSRQHLLDSIPQFDQSHPEREHRTLEAQIMDWADDVAYAVHDLEDFIKVGLIPLDRLRRQEDEYESFMSFHQKRYDLTTVQLTEAKRASQTPLDWFPLEGAFSSSSQARAAIRQFTSSLVRGYVVNLDLKKDPIYGSTILEIPDDLLTEVKVLKSLVWYYVIQGSAMAAQRLGQKALIDRVLNTLLIASGVDLDRKELNSAVPDDFLKILPLSLSAPLVEMKNLKSHEQSCMVVRALIDFVAGMTEPQLVKFDQRIHGYKLGSALDPIIY